MGIKNVVKKVGDKAGNKIAKLAALSSDQVEKVQLQREEYLLEKPDPADELAIDTTWRMMAASSVEIFNAYLPQIKDLYLPIEKSAEYEEAFSPDHNIRYFNITKWVQDKKENSLEKLVNVYAVLSNEECNIALVFNRTQKGTNVYLAVVNTANADNNVNTNSYKNRLLEAIRGNFPGAEWGEEGIGVIPCMKNDKPYSVATASNIPTEKSEKFISQTIEKLLDGIIPTDKKQEYTIVLLATPIKDVEQRKLKLCEFYSGMKPYAEWQTNFTYTESNTETVVETESKTDTDKLSESAQSESTADTQAQTKPVEQQMQTSNSELVVEADYANLTPSEGFVFESNGDGTCTLTEIGTCSDTDIVIPEMSPTGDKVTMIAEYAFYGAEDISSIVFAGRIMELDKKAFQSCEAEKIVITGCDLIIGENAFSYCEDVSEVYISNSTLEVDTYAFYDAGKDMDVKITNCTGVLAEKAFQSCGITGLTINDSTLELEENVFSYCEDLTTITFNNTTVDIGTYSFYDSGKDATVTFTNCGLNMDDKAFQCCGLTTLNISDSETVMEENTFSYCEDLTDITIGANNTEIGTYSFYDCPALVNVSIASDSEDDSIKIVIDDKAFQSCSVQNVVIGRGETVIGDNAFSYCEDLVSVELKGSLSDIGDYAFYDCPDELVITYNGATYNKESIEDAE